MSWWGNKNFPSSVSVPPPRIYFLYSIGEADDNCFVVISSFISDTFYFRAVVGVSFWQEYKWDKSVDEIVSTSDNVKHLTTGIRDQVSGCYHGYSGCGINSIVSYLWFKLSVLGRERGHSCWFQGGGAPLWFLLPQILMGLNCQHFVWPWYICGIV